MRARVGSYKGRSQVGSEFIWGPMGTVYVSNIRLVFKADNSPDVAIAPFTKILAFESYNDGLGLTVDGVGEMRIQTGNVILGRLLQHIVSTRSSHPRADNITSPTPDK
jgi:hypothetical protein